jgi:hypothetical protein
VTPVGGDGGAAGVAASAAVAGSESPTVVPVTTETRYEVPLSSPSIRQRVPAVAVHVCPSGAAVAVYSSRSPPYRPSGATQDTSSAPSAAVAATPVGGPGRTRTGVCWSAPVPSPSCCHPSAPQQYVRPALDSPQLCAAPAATPVNVRPDSSPLASTATGTDRSVVLPSPSCPWSFAPQQYTPAGDVAQVCPSPALIRLSVTPTGAATGTSESAAPPLPSWPREPAPQQYASPALVSAQAWSAPALIQPNVAPDASTATGVVASAVAPLPNRPFAPAPQQYASPTVDSPQAKSPPALICLSDTPPGTDTTTGDGASVVAPLPSRPWPPAPQQYAMSTVDSPQVKPSPAPIWVSETPPGRATATGVSAVVPDWPSPSWPEPLSPQQYAVPAEVTAHVWSGPALTLTGRPGTATSTGGMVSPGPPPPTAPAPSYPQQNRVLDRNAQVWSPPADTPVMSRQLAGRRAHDTPGGPAGRATGVAHASAATSRASRPAPMRSPRSSLIGTNDHGDQRLRRERLGPGTTLRIRVSSGGEAWRDCRSAKSLPATRSPSWSRP